jgi:hypothetical protein
MHTVAEYDDMYGRNYHVTKKVLRTAVQTVLAPGTNCNKDITKQFGQAPGHGSIDDLMTHIGDVSIWDTTVPGIGSLTMGEAFGDVPGTQASQTLTQWVEGSYAAIPDVWNSALGAYVGISAIVIGANFFSQNTESEQQSNLTHEMLHIYTGLDDDKLAAALGLQVGNGNPSRDITEYLDSDCKKKVF